MSEHSMSKFQTASLLTGLTLIALLLVAPLSPLVAASILLLICLVFWITESLPSALVGLLVPLLCTVTGLLTSAEAFESFGSSIVILIICVMILTQVVLTSGLAERFALILLAGPLTGTTLRSLCFGVVLSCWLSAWWVSNTAACALFIPIVLALSVKLERSLGKIPELYSVRYRLLLTCAFVPSLGGMVTPVGSLPNLVSLKALADQGIPFTFAGWMAFGLPASLAFLIALLLIFEFRYPVSAISLRDLKKDLQAERAGLKPMNHDQWCATISFAITVLLWLTPSLSKLLPHGLVPQTLVKLPVHSAAIIGVVVLFSLVATRQKNSQITWKNASEFDWGIVLLFAGGLCLGEALTAAKLPEYAFTFLGVSQLTAENSAHGLPAFIPLLLIPLTIILSEVCSNTVAAAILVPAVLDVVPGNVVLPVVIALGAGFGFMLPISTPPNALVHGTGKLPLRHMVITGLLFDILGAIVLFAYYKVLTFVVV